MPMRAPSVRACCGRRLPVGEPCSCQAKRTQERKDRFDQRRPSAADRGYDGKWRRESKAFIAAHPVCERIIGDRICGKPATLVHHVIAHKGDRKLFWSRSNWSRRCAACHNGAEQSQEKRALR